MTRIRAAALPQAEACAYFPLAAAAAPSDSAEAAAGRVRHTWLGRAAEYVLGGGPDPGESPEGVPRAIALRMLGELGPAQARIEEEVLHLSSLGGEIPGHVDLIIDAGFGRRLVVDWKTGPRQPYALPSPLDSLQLAAYALATGADEIAFAVVEPDGIELRRRDVSGRWAGEMRARIDAVVARVGECEARKRGPIVGPHCERCYSQAGCPAARDQLRQLALPAAGELTGARLAEAVELLPAARALLRRVEEAAQAEVERAGPIMLPAGQRWGRWPGGRESVVDPVAAHAVVGAELGAEAAEEAVPLRRYGTKTSIVAAAKRAGGKDAADRVVERLRRGDVLARAWRWGIEGGVE